jgi:membrane protein
VILGGLRGAVSRFFANDGMFLAAGLAFFFLLSMIPLILLGVATVGFVLSTEQAANEVVGQLARNFPVYKHELTRVLLRIVQTRTMSGVLGTVVLVLFATPLFGASRLVTHRLLGIRGRENFFKNLLRDAGMVLVLGVLLFVLSAGMWILYWVQFVVLKPAHMPTAWINAFALLGGLALSAVMFYLAYRYVPRRRMRVGPALAGAVLASVLWEIAKQLFRIYIREVGVYDQIYGPLGVLVAFVMFVYYSAIVFVFAGAYAAVLDGGRRS